MIKKILNFLFYPIQKYIDNRKLKKRIAELRKRDPFIYK
jgi:hypothetical protein